MAVIELTPSRISVQAGAPLRARGGVDLGRVSGADPAGQALSQFGQTLTELEDRTRTARNQRELMVAGAEYAEGLADLRGRMERNDPEFQGNPVEAYSRGAEALRAQIRERFGDGEAQAMFDARARVAAAGERPAVIAFSARREAEATQAALSDTLATFARGAAAENEPGLRAQRVRGAEDAIAGALSTGAISATQAQRLRQTFMGSLDQADVLRLINRSPGEAVRALSDPNRFQNLDDVQRERLFGTATSRASAMAAQAEAAAGRRERSVMLEFNQVNGLLQAGIVPEDRVQRLQAAAQGTALAPSINQAVTDARALQPFRLASNEDQVRLLGEAETRARGPNATDADLAQLGRLRTVRQAQLQAYQQDGLGAAVAEGIVPPQPPIDWANPATLNSRVEAAAGVSQRRGYAVSPFNREDLAAGVEAFTRGNPDQRLAIVQAVAGIADPAVRTEAMRHFERARGDAGRMPPGTLARVSDMLRDGSVESMQAARRLITDLSSDVSGRAPNIGENTELRSALNTAQSQSVQGVRVMQAQLTGDSRYAATVSRDMDAIGRSVQVALTSGESSVTRAVEGAQARFNTGLAVVNDSGLAHVYFPARSASPAQVTAGLRALRAETVTGVNIDPALGADQAAAARARRTAAERGVWINEGSTFSLVVPGQAGAPVVLRSVRLEDVVRAAEAQTRREATEPPQRPPQTAPTGPVGVQRTPAATLPSLRQMPVVQ